MGHRGDQQRINTAEKCRTSCGGGKWEGESSIEPRGGSLGRRKVCGSPLLGGHRQVMNHDNPGHLPNYYPYVPVCEQKRVFQKLCENIKKG